MENEAPIYLDHNATTPLAPEVLEAMMPFLTHEFGNASSRHHAYGTRVHEAVEAARAQVAGLINCEPDEVLFTSGATESDNFALRGVMAANQRKGNHLITVATEHKAVLEPARQLADDGFEVTVLPVKRDGLIRLDDLREALRPETVMVSVMYANNEIGVIQPVDEIGAICREAGVYFHSDAAQAVGKIPVDVQASKIDLLSISAHKFYGPKGVGALYMRRRKPRVRVKPVVHGGGHERGLRSGTLNSPGIVGLGAACDLAGSRFSEWDRVKELRDQLLVGLKAVVPDLEVNGSMASRLAGNLNVRIPGVNAEALLYRLEGVAISSGAACTTLKIEPSHVLLALGLNDNEALQSVRLSLGLESLRQPVDSVPAMLATQCQNLRAFVV